MSILTISLIELKEEKHKAPPSKEMSPRLMWVTPQLKEETLSYIIHNTSMKGVTIQKRMKEKIEVF